MAFPINAISFKLRFKEFGDQPDARIEFAIEEASRDMDPTCWLTGDYLRAFNYLAAHYLMVDISREESGTGQQVTSEKIGSDLSITYATPEQPSRVEKTDFNTTSYGVRYSQILRLNFPPLVVV